MPVMHHPAGRNPITARMRSQLPQITERMVTAGLGSTAPTADLPTEHFAAELVPAIHNCALAFFQAVEQQRDFPRSEVARIIGPVVEHHAEDRLPLVPLLEAVHGSAQQVLTEAAALATAEEISELVAFGSRLVELLMQITITVVEVYRDVTGSMDAGEREARHGLCSALLQGDPPEELAARADVLLHEQYTVLAIALPPNQPLATGNDLIVRRRIRILQHTLDQQTSIAPLHNFNGTSGMVLIPGAAPEFATELSELFGTTVIVAEFTEVPRADIPQVATQAADLAAVALGLGRATGTYHLDDVLLEYQLTRPGPARDRLAERIAGLAEHPHLWEALETHLRYGTDRKTAAAEMFVHPNTFSYRLRRITELIGLDPSDPGDSRILAAALLVYRLHPPTPTS